MWQTKRFKTRQAMQSWINANAGHVQWHEIFINNAYGVQFRILMRMG